MATRNGAIALGVEGGILAEGEPADLSIFSSQVAERVASQCVEFHGGVGFTKEFPAEKFYRDAKIGSIYEGTSNMQLQTIAKMLLDERG